MILLFPLVLVGVVFVCRSSGARREGWRWFWAWACFGASFVFALLTGFSIGLFLLPVVAVVGVAVARRASGWREALGAVAGAAVVVEALAVRNGWTASLLAAAVGLVAIAAYAKDSGRRGAQGLGV
jgi:cytochrome bd-type quinol oxidase subunit 2